MRALKWSKILFDYFEIQYGKLSFKSAAFLLIRVVFLKCANAPLSEALSLGWLIDWLVDWSVGRLVGWSVGCQWLVNWNLGGIIPMNDSTSPSRQLDASSA